MNKAARATLIAISAALAAFIVLTLLFLLFELMGFDYLLWDAPRNTHNRHNPNDSIDGLFGTLLYLLLPTVLSIIVYKIVKSKGNARIKEREPAQTDPRNATTVAAAMANAGYQDNLDKACSWADHLFRGWSVGNSNCTGTNADGSQECRVHVSCQFDTVAGKISVQITFMVRPTGTATPVLEVNLLTLDDGNPTKPTVNQLCELTDERLDMLKGALQHLSGRTLR